LAGAAQASFKGTAGKVVFLGNTEAYPLQLWDPVTEATETIAPTTWEPGQSGTVVINTVTIQVSAGGLPSAPSWSPDGTQFAYAKLIDDGGNVKGLKHSAIFVYDLKTKTERQLTHPEDAKYDLLPEQEPTFGHTVADWSPMWSSDGTTVAFVRKVMGFGPDDELWSQRGQNLWRIPAAGGSPTQVTKYVQESFKEISEGTWIPGTNDLVVSYFSTSTGAELRRLNIGGGTPSYLAGSLLQLITDFDVSPDGTKLAYNVLGAGGTAAFVQPLTGPGAGTAVSAGSTSGALLRFSGSGDGLLHGDCTRRNPSICGLVNHLLDDPEAEIDPGQADRLALAWTPDVGGTGGLPAHSAFDIQPQTLPVIYLPGFLGSEIECSTGQLWPALPNPKILAMSLDPIGVTTPACPDVHPGGLFEGTKISDVYRPAANFIRNTFPDGRGHLFAWDWRRRPQPTLDKLHQKVLDALAAPGPWKDQGTGRVVLVGHSYGGLLMRAYVKEHHELVARAVTFATPFFGAPKAVFPLFYGVETPQWGIGIDLFVRNAEMRQFAINLAGAYQLFPSDRYPAGWLTYDGVRQANADATVQRAGGNLYLAQEARQYHSSIYEGFEDYGQRLDLRAVVGTGLGTFDRLAIAPHAGDDDTLSVLFTGGDGTVPEISAGQGPAGGPPLGDPIPIQYTCNIDHVALGGAAPVLDAYKDWLDFGRVPRKLPDPCKTTGYHLDFEPGTLDLTPPAALRSRASGVAAAAAGLGLEDAEAAGLIDLVRLPRQTIAVTSDIRPVTLRFALAGATFSSTSYTAAGSAAPQVYGPLTGTVEVAPGVGGPSVTVDGVAVAPQGGAAVTPPPSVPAASDPGTSAAGAGATSAPTPLAATTPAVTSRPSNAFSIVGAVRLRGRTLKLTLALPGPGALRVGATARSGKRTRTLASQRATVRAAGRRTITLKLKGARVTRLALTVAFTPSGGLVRTRKLTVVAGSR
jgi:pimeloyl-ACP methyl ester carboxylesterase